MIKSLYYPINYVWRLFATGLSFIIFAIGALILSYLLFPLISLLQRDRNKRCLQAQYLINRSFRGFVTLLQCFCLLRVRYRGFEQLQSDRGCLIISNHPSLIDIVLIIAKLKHCNIIVKDALWQNIFIKRVVSYAGYLANAPQTNLAEPIQNTLNQGNNLFLFPEGTRTTPGQPLKFQRGAANIALRMNTQIRPITINSTTSGLTKQDKWYTIPQHKLNFTITVAALIDPTPYLSNAGSASLAARYLTRDLQQQLQQDIEK